MTFRADYEVRDDGICVITPEGRLNAVSVSTFKQEILNFLEKKNANRLIMNMSKVDFIDSSGLSMLVTLLKRTRELDGFFRIAAVRPEALKIIKLTLLDRVFEIYPTVESAVEKKA